MASVNFIHENPGWPDLSWDGNALSATLAGVRHRQGLLLGKMATLGFDLRLQASLTVLTNDVVKTSAIEGEVLPPDEVRSSIARRLGLDVGGLVRPGRNVDGVVEMMLDATQRHNLPLTKKRLLGWHAALFPTGYSGLYKIEVGQYRTGEMQIVSGAMGKEKVHYEAVNPKFVKVEMDKFLEWFNKDNTLDIVMKAAIAHFWFIIIHPFDDGNGRIGRAITDMLLARAEGSGERFYSMSSQILSERKRYYQILQKVQHSSGDITEWLYWFLHCLKNAMLATENTTQKIVRKAEFWKLNEHTIFNERQRLMLNKLFDGFEGKLQTSKWAKIAKTSTDTALRDIKDLVAKGILQQMDEGGRNANYELADFKSD